MILNLKAIPVPDMIHLHTKTGEVIYNDLMKVNLKESKLQYTMSTMENKLRQEKLENKVHQQQIKNFQGDLLAIDNEENKGDMTQNMIDDKENTIQLLKKNLSITATQLIQDCDLTEL